MRALGNIYWLGTKELRSVLRDTVLMGLVIYSFSLAIMAQSQSSSQEVHNASIAFVDEDKSVLSRRIAGAFLPPYFLPPRQIAERDIVPAMDAGRYTFVVDIPPHLERDTLAGAGPAIQLNVDATAMVQAGIGTAYAQTIIADEVAGFVSRSQSPVVPPVDLIVRIAYNPNNETSWFTSVMGVLNSITMLSIILPGAAIIREREHGTMDHLLVMPLTPFQIAMAKIWANGLVVLLAVAASVYLVLRLILHVSIAGSIPLFLFGVASYLFFATSLGVFLGTVARSMPQLGLLYLLVYVPLAMLSGSNTPLESMPHWLATLLQVSPTVHFVALAQAILFRGAGFPLVWREFVFVALAGALFLSLALLRFRKVITATR